MARQAAHEFQRVVPRAACLTSTPPLPHHPGSDVDWHDSTPPLYFEVFSNSADWRRARGQHPPCSAMLALVCEVSILASVLPAASGLRYSLAASAAKRRRELRRDAKRAPMAETGSAAQARCPRVSQARSAAMVQAPGRLHIGGSAYFVWADPPNGACTARRPVAGHRRTLFALSTAKPLF